MYIQNAYVFSQTLVRCVTYSVHRQLLKVTQERRHSCKVSGICTRQKAKHACHQLAEDMAYVKSNHDVLLSFDLQQTLPTPQLTMNIVFY